jgi:hypothetical protein
MKSAGELFSLIHEFVETFNLLELTDSGFERAYYNNIDQLVTDGLVLHDISPRSALNGLKISFIYSECLATFVDGAEIMSIVIERGIIINNNKVVSVRTPTSETRFHAPNDRVEFEREKHEEARQERKVQGLRVVFPNPRRR